MRYQDSGNFPAGDADYSRVTFFFLLFSNMSEITVLPERQSKLSDIMLGNITAHLQNWSRLLLLLFHTILIVSNFSEFQKHPLLFQAFVP